MALAIGVIVLARRLLVRFAGWRPAELSLPANAPRPSALSRGVESSAVWLIGLALVGSGVLNVWWYGVDLDVVPAAQQRHEFVVLALLAVSITALAAMGVVWRMGVSIVATGVLLSSYFSLLDQGTISRRPASDADVAACPIEIRMEDGTAGADVWVNGVKLGRTPLTVTLADWMKLPQWLDAPTTGPDGHDVESKRAFRKPRWVPCIVKPDRRWTKTALPEGTYFVWAEIGDEPLVSMVASGTNVSFDGVQWMASPILIMGQSPTWLTELDRLLDRARARDYPLESLDEWLTAMHSFGEAGWRAALRTAESEPSLKFMLEELLRRDMGLTRSTWDDAAWAIFEKLERQATEAREYQSESRLGRSLELLLPYLDRERLARYAAGVVDDLRWIPSLSSWDHRRRGDDWRGERPYLTLSHTSKDLTHFRRRDQLARLSFLAHAVWKMDELLDNAAADPFEDNPIEQLVVPALWRRDTPAGYGFGELKQLASQLGGSLIRRRYEWLIYGWHRRNEPMDLQLARRIALAAMKDDSAAARRWWGDHADDTLEFADKISIGRSQWQHNVHAVPFGDSEWQLENHAFLFTAVDSSGEPLAARYWPKFRDRVVATSWPPVRKLEALWSYLFRLEPYSTPEMYVAAWRACGFDLLLVDEPRLDETEIVTWLSHDKRKGIIAALTVEAQARLKNAQADGARRRVDELEETLRQINQLQRWKFASQAQKALSQFDDREDREAAFDSLARVLVSEIPASPELRELLESPDPKKRLLGARAVRTHPAPHIRPLLAKLLEDDNADVKAFANEPQDLWQQLVTDAPQTFSIDNQTNPKR
jgi:hypothetical protein